MDSFGPSTKTGVPCEVFEEKEICVRSSSNHSDIWNRRLFVQRQVGKDKLVPVDEMVVTRSTRKKNKTADREEGGRRRCRKEDERETKDYQWAATAIDERTNVDGIL